MRKLPLLLAHLACVTGLVAMAQGGISEPRRTVPGIEAASLTPLPTEAREDIEVAAQPVAPQAGPVVGPERGQDRVERRSAPTRPTVQIAPDVRCPQWWETAVAVGWTLETLSSMDAVIHKESRCKPRTFNQKDPNGGSRGLLQINGSWRRWLRDRDVIETEDDLYDPATNLKAAWLIYQYGMDRYDFGWGPWGFRYVDPYEVYTGGK